MSTLLYLQVFLFRILQQINAYLDIYLMMPRVSRHDFTRTISSRLSKHPGPLRLYFYTPKGYKLPGLGTLSAKKYPLVVNFYGGGFTLGHAHDDGRWACSLLQGIDAVYVSVDYRRGPRYPQPTAVEDCVDAIEWLWTHADDYNIDRDRTILTGFSAGGNLTFTTSIRLYEERQKQGTDSVAYMGTVTGIVPFYPVVDMSVPREVKLESNPFARTKGSIPLWMARMFDEAYHRGSPQGSRTSISLSPALAPKDVLKKALPVQIAIYTCEWDQLLKEAEDFRKELALLGKSVSGYMVPNAPHAFDKPFYSGLKKQRDEMYGSAIEQIKNMI